MAASHAAPDEAMMRPIERIARFMATLDDACLKGAFADDGVTILENFAPFVFTGGDAVARWAKLFRAHAEGLAGLKHAFGPAQDFHVENGLAYLALPTTWTGTSRGQPFRETGGWSFVLALKNGEWCVKSYGWAVTSYEKVS
jgi:hypothetical protein